MLIRWQSTVATKPGPVFPGAVLTIRRESDQALVTVFRDKDGSNPYPTGTVTADENGYAYFYAMPDMYRITSLAPKIDWRDINLATPNAQLAEVAVKLATELDSLPPPSDYTLAFVWGDVDANNGLWAYDITIPGWVRAPASSQVVNQQFLFTNALALRPNIGSGYDLDTFVQPGIYHQSSNSWASGGQNYPGPFAGKLEVYYNDDLTSVGVFIYQRYSRYNSHEVYLRSSYDGVWTSWQQVSALPFTPFPSNAGVVSSAFIGKQAIPVFELWGIDRAEDIYLYTFWNFYYNATQDKHFASIGFKSSANYHIAPSLSPQTDIALFAQWEIAARLTGRAEYLLYRDGDGNTPPVGRVVVDWDQVTNTEAQRYIASGTQSPVKKDETRIFNFASMSEGPGQNWWAGKRVGGLGDSITWGFTPRNQPNPGTQLQSWLPLMAAKLGMSTLNYGISGSTLGALPNGDAAPMSRRWQDMDDDLDLIFVMGGTNDLRQGIPVGVMSDRVDTTYYGALHVICEGLTDKYRIAQGTASGSQRKIVLVTPTKLQATDGSLNTALEPYVQAVKEVAAYYSLPVLDFYNLSGITPHILQTVQGTDPGYTGMYNAFITDGTHPTQDGQEMMSLVSAGFALTLVP